MVRLVLRPLSQVKTSICPLNLLQASIKLSPDFALLTHSSPSFGSQRIRSNSDLSQVTDRSMVHLAIPTSAHAYACLYFHCALGFDTQILAYTLDSLVRVSRRVRANHYVNIANLRVHNPTERRRLEPDNLLYDPLDSVVRVGWSRLSIPQSRP